MTETTDIILVLAAVAIANAIYALQLLRRLYVSEMRRVDAERERDQADVWADRWESQAAKLAQENGNLRRQHASLQALYAARMREALAGSHGIVMTNVNRRLYR